MGKRRIPIVPPDEPGDSLLGKPVEDELDLHGLEAYGATRKLEFFLQRWSRARPGAVVRVITGRGNRSGGTPILHPLVGRLLAGELGRYAADHRPDVGGGAFLVRVK